MSEVTKILIRLEAGDSEAMHDLLPLVDAELRRLASARLNRERSDFSLQVTELVNEAYIRLADGTWKNRRHFFGAAGEAMRRILVDHARNRDCAKRGGELQKLELIESFLAVDPKAKEIIAIHEALDDLEAHEPQAAELVKLRYFVGMKHSEAADALGMTTTSRSQLFCPSS